MSARIRPSVVLQGLWFVAFGVLFLVDLGGAVQLRPSLLWPGLLIAWGTVLLAEGMDRPR